MRIVFVQAGLGAGGAEKIVHLLASHRAHCGDDVTVLASSGGEGKSYFKYPSNIQVETFSGNSEFRYGRKIVLLRRIIWLRRRFQKLKPDVIVSFLSKTNVLVLASSRGLSVPVVVSERNNPKQQSAHPVWRLMGKMLMRFADGIVMQSKAAQETLAPKLQSRSTVIANPCIVTESVTSERADGCRIVGVGRLDPQKGFDLLLRAFAKTSKRVPAATLTIYGEGLERSRLEKQAESLAISDRVSFPGLTVTPGAWQSEGDVFVLSSRFEGFPNVLLEAMASGFAAVAFDCSWGPSDIIDHGKNGLLVPVEDTDALADAMAQLCLDQQVREAFRLAAPATAKKFSVEDILMQWDSLLGNFRAKIDSWSS